MEGAMFWGNYETLCMVCLLFFPSIYRNVSDLMVIPCFEIIPTSFARRVIPKALMPLEISGQTIGEVRTVLDMHERKAVMAREADAFIALPGGFGTMEETLEMITWSQLGIHKKPVGLLNVEGYYNSLLALFDNGVKEGFIKPSARDIVLSAPTAKELMIKMEQYTPSHEHVASHESWQMHKLGDYPGQ
ncbi:hypothetical protein EUGRSUZ_C00668 [Eucalyptus grandis]|uniref:Uncharacterized protein n=2 Tax=Eucalyptus grandis TaxID=71139 RepID=A0ACC3LBA3_EUCGR|nr:hypothetical protein EUGRSUZ_C00668 [Eucalyptus grandis]